MLAIGIDLGGTQIKTVLIDGSGTVIEQGNAPTRDGDDSVWKTAVADAVSDLKSVIGQREFVIGLSAPGLPTDNHGAIAFMPGRMQGLEGFHWKDFLGHPAYVLNDAVAALMAALVVPWFAPLATLLPVSAASRRMRAARRPWRADGCSRRSSPRTT